MESASDNSFHQTKTPISFLYKLGLNLKSLIQLSKILPVKLIGTYIFMFDQLMFIFLYENGQSFQSNCQVYALYSHLACGIDKDGKIKSALSHKNIIFPFSYNFKLKGEHCQKKNVGHIQGTKSLITSPDKKSCINLKVKH